MGFDWVYLNPLHYPGFSGSLYAVKDYYQLNPLFRDQSGRDDATLLAEFTGTARDRGLKIMMDLVVNHTAKDSLLAEQHPDWFARERDGSIRSPFAVDPADTRKKTVWGDLGEIDYDNAAILPALADYWAGVVRHHIQRGFVGFRCDAAYKVPADVWRRIIADARRMDSNVRFFAETLGCRLEQIEKLADAGFDYLFNSVKWWDFEAPWALEQYEMFRHIAPSIAFPESHDTERLANELPADLPRPDDIRKWLVLRYALAACFSTGVLMPVGYEYGFRRRLDVVRTRPADWEKPQFDLSREIAAINRMKAACPALNEEG
ncbi:MAG: alpha-amylase family glycosyl hydrolase, partial [Terriglobia bacterium]